MIQSRILPEDPSVELLDGLLVRKDRGVKGGDKMTVGPAHNLVIKKLTRLAPRIDALQCHLQTQGPIAIPPSSEPEPDAAVIRGSPEDYATSVPVAKDAVVVIEVADSSLDTDRTTKLRAYAAAGIQQYVIVNIPDVQIELYTRPVAAEGRYATIANVRAGEALRLDLLGASFEVPAADLLP